MAYDEMLAARVRAAVAHLPEVEEKTMFSGLAFMVNGKMCVNVSGNRLMCRFDPALTDVMAERSGFEEMVMKGRVLKGYCYVAPEGFRSKDDFNFWIERCLDFNKHAKASKKKN
ncbi:MAG: TfoX/Sxy family protein [Williamsia sp.]|nr:TfoX/Sxy family protein [Williamsia sp.]